MMQRDGTFRLEEASIADVHAAYRAGATSARAITQAFLDRIEAYDRRGPALWTLVVTNPDALSDADALDRHLAATGEFVGPHPEERRVGKEGVSTCRSRG